MEMEEVEQNGQTHKKAADATLPTCLAGLFTKKSWWWMRMQGERRLAREWMNGRAVRSPVYVVVHSLITIYAVLRDSCMCRMIHMMTTPCKRATPWHVV